MVKAIIFDMDGVLLIQKHSIFNVERIFSDKGLSVDHLDPSIFVGGRASQIWQRILGDDYDNWDVPALEEEYRVYKEKRPTPYAERIFPEVKAVLERLTIKVFL